MKKITLLALFVLTLLNSYAQTNTVDSLKALYEVAKHDTTKCNLLSLMSESCNENEIFAYSEQLEKFVSAKLKGLKKQDKLYDFYSRKLASAINNKGYSKQMQGDDSTAMVYYHKSLEILEKTSDKYGQANCLNNIGYVYFNQGKISDALEYWHKALNIFYDLKENKGLAILYNNLGAIYDNLDEDEKAIEYYNKSYKYYLIVNDKSGQATQFNNIGYFYLKHKDYEKALTYYEKSLKLSEAEKDNTNMATTLLNTGVCYIEKKEMDKAYKSFTRALTLFEEIGDKFGMGLAYDKLAAYYSHSDDLDKAVYYANKSLELGRELGYPKNVLRASDILKKVYTRKKKYVEAIQMYDLSEQMEDSINNMDIKKNTIKNQYKFEYEVKAKEDSIKTIENKKVIQAELEREKTFKYALFGGLFLVILFALFMYNRFKVTQRQKDIITLKEQETQRQKHLIEEKNSEILQSISYAKRLQESILPPPRLVKEYIKESFILYMPKDIVAGDFYWMESIDDIVYFAAADCTGHGVPGAMVSMVCHNALNRALLEFNEHEPGRLLDKVNELVVDTFSKSDDEVKDGMDISLCAFDKNKLELKWAGANNPLWIINAGTASLTEYKPDKQPIGNYENRKPFVTHTIQLKEGDSIYIFTDGYPDQFGGEKGKKFMYKQLQQTFLNINQYPMTLQKDKLIEIFLSWKGELDQVDDICMIGVKV